MQGAQANTCFRVLFGIGMLCVLIGVVSYPSLRVEFQLDAVLSAVEQQDVVQREATRKLLIRANGHLWIVWLAVGIANIAVSLTGLRSNRVAA